MIPVLKALPIVAKNAATLLAVSMALLLFFFSTFTNATDFNKLANLAAQRYGERARTNVVELQQTLNGLQSASEAEKLNAIN